MTFNSDDFPRHLTLTLAHNDIHESVEDIVKNYPDGEHFADWISSEQRELAILHNDVWTIQWYPDTPVGFIAYAAYDLGALLEFVKGK